jgi:hypothetical protein
MKSRQDINDLSQALQAKIFTASFFRTVERVVKFTGESIYFVHDRYTIKDLGVRHGRKWVELNNSNACSPFHSIILGLKTDLPVKTWWKEQKYQENFGTEDSPHIANWSYFPDTEKPLIIRYVIGSGDALKDIVPQVMAKPLYDNLLNMNYKGWWFDTPDWIDRFSALGILTDLLEVFKDWKKMDRG